MTDESFIPVVDQTADLFQSCTAWVPKTMRDLTVDELLRRPAAGRSHLYWIFGHMVLYTDIAPFINGSPAIIPNRYVELFDFGTRPKDTAADYPPIAEMADLFDRAVENAVRALKSIGDQDLVKPTAVPLPPGLVDFMSTRYEVIKKLGLHLVYHVGQIGTILKILGKGGES